MKVYRNRSAVSFDTFRDQYEETGRNYIFHDYLIRYDDVIYNSITGEIVEANEVQDRDYLIQHWFLIPDDLDIVSFAHLIHQREKLLKSSDSIDSYTIFTTMNCNASCEYCFQAGSGHKQMSEVTAKNVARFIKSHKRKSTNANIRWFGGEPLLNKNAINIISEDLNSFGVPFSSIMSTNGDLFNTVSDEELSNWKLRRIHLTMDAAGDEYDRVKGLKSGAYERAKETVARLYWLGIDSTIRIHLNPEKGIDAPLQIIEDFKDYPGVTMYAAILYGLKTSEKDYDNLLKIEDKIIETGKTRYRFPDVSRGAYCMGDSSRTACVTVDGHLTSCEHFPDDQTYGTIYSDLYDIDILNDWARKRKHRDACVKCSLYPTCELLCNCPSVGKCEDGYRYYLEQKVKRALKALKERNGGSNEQG